MRLALVLLVLALMAAVMWLPRRTPRDERRRTLMIKALAWIAIGYLLLEAIGVAYEAILAA